MSRILILLIASFVLLGISTSSEARQTRADLVTLDVWPEGKVPGEPSGIGAEVDEKVTAERPIRRITNVTRPTITVFAAPKDKNTGAAVLIAPGGGYNILAYDLEGEEVAEWLNSIGVTGIVLKYRVPRREGTAQGDSPIEPLQDAQRALRVVRSKAADWGIDPARLGMLGFSAGGSLTARAATSFDKKTYEVLDVVDGLSARPDFAVLVYPGGVEKDGELKPEITVSSQTPPLFFAHAGDDRVRAENSVLLYLALRKVDVPAELHIYTSGGHGFGLRPSDQPCSTWPARCEEWMRSQGWLKSRE